MSNEDRKFLTPLTADERALINRLRSRIKPRPDLSAGVNRDLAAEHAALDRALMIVDEAEGVDITQAMRDQADPALKAITIAAESRDGAKLMYAMISAAQACRTPAEIAVLAEHLGYLLVSHIDEDTALFADTRWRATGLPRRPS